MIDFSPLQESPAFRRLWFGTAVSTLGGQLSSYAIMLQAWSWTHSTAAVGGIGLAIGVPRFLFALLGGAMSDVMDRRRLVLLTGCALLAISAILTTQSALHQHQLWILYAAAAGKAALSAVAGPARATFVRSLLAHNTVPAGVALGQISSELAVFVGPMAAGWLTSWFGFTICYLLDSLSYLASLYGVHRLPRGALGRARSVWWSVPEGVGHIVGSPIISAVLLADLAAMVLAYPSALLPALNSRYFQGDASTLGLMLSAMALGGLLSSMLSGPVARADRPGRLVLAAAAVWGASLALVGLTHSLWLIAALLLIAGAADTISVVARGTVVQLSTGAGFEGRVNAASQSIGVAGPALGNFRAGLVGSALGAESALVAGGVMSILATALIAIFFPAARAYSVRDRAAAPAGITDSRPDEPAATKES